MIPRLALLSALKHYKRSLVSIGAVAVVTAVMISIGSLLGGIMAGFYDSITSGSGHVRIDDGKAGSALNPLSLDLFIPDAAQKIAAIEALGDGRIAGIEGVVSFGALLVEDKEEGDPRNLPMRGIGLSPDSRFADNVRPAMVRGGFLPGGEGVAVSEAAARLVGCELGGRVVVLVQDRSGQPWYESLPVTGVFKTESSDFDETTFYISEAKAAEMLDVAGSAREIRILLKDRRDAESVAAEISSALAAGGQPGLRVMSWRDINASVLAILVFMDVLLGIVMGLFAVVAGTIIANTSIQSVMERLREYGTMRAIGLRGRSLARLIMTEGVILGAAGAVLGLALGSAFVALASGGGIDLGGLMGSLGLARYCRPKADIRWYAVCAAAAIAVGLAANAKAAMTARSMSVAESLSAAA